MLSKEATKSLKEIMQRDYGVEISDTEADEVGGALLRLARVAMCVTARGLENIKSPGVNPTQGFKKKV